MEIGDSESDKRRELISLGELVDRILPRDKEGMKISPELRFGIRACYLIIFLAGLVLVGIIIYLLVSMSSLKLTPPTDEPALKVYQEARSMVLDEAIKISDQFLGKMLLPVLTLLLGYIFGRERRSNQEKS